MPDTEAFRALQGQVAALELVCAMLGEMLTQRDPRLREELVLTLNLVAGGYDFPPDASRAFTEAFSASFDEAARLIREAPP